MKELSIEEKAKAYDEALEKARQLCAYPTSKPFISDLQDLFPELAESEDEKIRKEIINYFAKGKEYLSLCSFSKEEILAWLEKQDPKKHEEELEKAYKTADEVQYKRGYEDAVKDTEKQGEQKPTIEIKTPEESLGIDSEIYNKIVDECIYGDDKQKPAWSEEDEEHYKACLQYFDAVNPDMVYYKDYQWLKSLKQKIGG